MIAAFTVSDTHLDAGYVLGAQCLQNGLHAFLAACGTLGTDPDRADRQIHIIMDDQDILRCNMIVVDSLGYCASGVVHVGQRLQQQYVFPMNPHRGDQCIPLHSKIDGAAHLRQFINYHKATVVPCLCVFLSGISQSGNQLHSASSFSGSSAGVSSMISSSMTSSVKVLALPFSGGSWAKISLI